MKVLLTGASSFTGYWFARMLAESSHEVVAPLMREIGEYSEGARAVRVAELQKIARVVPNCRFGDDSFLDLIGEGFDLLAHHAAQVGNYRSPDFDVTGAVGANTYNLRAILQSGKIGAIVLTSSVFAQGEGAGSQGLPAFSAYGLSKGLTNDIAMFYAREAQVPFGRFVIPNPFGPLEEPRFCAYLMQKWKAGQVAVVNTPAYVRDNIHVDLLAKCYAKFVQLVVDGSGHDVLSPSGYVSSQGEFAQRFARELGARLGLSCDLDLANQTEFPEPIIRVNTEPATQYVGEWNEIQAWDNLADFYR